MITPTEIQEIVLAHVYKIIALPGDREEIIFAEIVKDLKDVIGRMAVEDSLRKMGSFDDHCGLIEIDFHYAESEGGKRYFVKAITIRGQKVINERIANERCLTHKYLVQKVTIEGLMS